MRPSPVVNYGWHLSKGLGFDNTGRIPLSLIYLLFFSKKKRKKKPQDCRLAGLIAHNYFTRVFCLFLSSR